MEPILLDRDWAGLEGGETRAVMMLREFIVTEPSKPWGMGEDAMGVEGEGGQKGQEGQK